MKKWMTVVLVVALACSQAWAQDITDPNNWSAMALGGDEMFQVRLLYDGGGRVKVGPELGWYDGIEGGQEAWSFGFAGTYDLYDDQLPLLGDVSVPCTWYIGVRGGVIVPDDSDVDATGGLLTGLAIGNERACIGIEGQYLLTDKLWSSFADVDGDEWRLMATGAFRF